MPNLASILGGNPWYHAASAAGRHGPEFSELMGAMASAEGSAGKAAFWGRAGKVAGYLGKPGVLAAAAVTGTTIGAAGAYATGKDLSGGGAVLTSIGGMGGAVLGGVAGASAVVGPRAMIAAMRGGLFTTAATLAVARMAGPKRVLSGVAAGAIAGGVGGWATSRVFRKNFRQGGAAYYGSGALLGGGLLAGGAALGKTMGVGALRGAAWQIPGAAAAMAGLYGYNALYSNRRRA